MRKMKIENRAQEAEKREQRQSNCASPGSLNRKSERGAALIVVLVMSAVALMVATALIYIVTTGTQISGKQKAYTTAREAGKGCATVFMQLIETRTAPQQLTDFGSSVVSLNYLAPSNAACQGFSADGATFNGIAAKIMTNSRTWTNCNTDININPADASTYDMSAEIGTASRYNCYGKIIMTTDGNTGNAMGLRTKGVVSTSGEVPAMPLSYLYTVEVLSVRTANQAERSKLSLLFQY